MTKIVKVTKFSYHLWFSRREAIYVPFSGVPVEVRPVRRVDPPLSKAHRSQAIQMQSLWTLLCQIWSFGASHEETLTKGAEATLKSFLKNSSHSAKALLHSTKINNDNFCSSLFKQIINVPNTRRQIYQKFTALKKISHFDSTPKLFYHISYYIRYHFS